MPLRYTYTDRTTLIEQERGRYVCPLRYPAQSGECCPVDDKRWEKGGCITTLALSIGARLRYQLDRSSQAYREVYNQRTATERINSQAVALGIERPKVRNGRAIANLNTLTQCCSTSVRSNVSGSANRSYFLRPPTADIGC